MPRLPSPWSVPLLTVEVAGQLLGMSRTVAYRATLAGRLQTVRIGGVNRVRTVDVYRLAGLPLPPRQAVPVVDTRH